MGFPLCRRFSVGSRICDHVSQLILNNLDLLGDQVDAAKRALYSLCSDEFHCYVLDKAATGGTCGWILERPEFKEWLANKPGKRRLWIRGPPGCGKSFLARHIITGVIPRSETEPIHCFLSKSAPARRDLRALLRSTLHQAFRLVLGGKTATAKDSQDLKRAERDPAEVQQDRVRRGALIREVLLPVFTKAEQSAPFRRDVWTEEILQSIWPDVMARAVADHDLTMVIDGLDEMKVDDQKAFLGCLKKFDIYTKGSQKLRILIVSGDGEEHGVAATPYFTKYTVTPSDTKVDMRKTVDEGLERIWRSRKCQDEDLKKRISATIVNDAEGNYLWAAMAVEQLRRSSEINEKALEKDKLPRDVGELYEVILKRVLGKKNGACFARLALQWGVFQEGKLKAAEFNTAQAVALALEKNASSKNPENNPSEGDLDKFLAGSIKAKVDFHCGGLVNLRDERLELVHSSLSTHLTTGASAFKFEEQQGHWGLAKACIAYLTMPQFQDPEIRDQKEDGWESKVRARIRKHNFLRYAARYWPKHLQVAGPELPQLDPEATRRIEQLKGSCSGPGKKGEPKPYAVSWSEAWWFLTKGAAEKYPQRCPAHQIVESESKPQPNNNRLPRTAEPAGPSSTTHSALRVPQEESDDGLASSETTSAGRAWSTYTSDRGAQPGPFDGRDLREEAKDTAASNMPSWAPDKQHEYREPKDGTEQRRRTSMDNWHASQPLYQSQNNDTTGKGREHTRTILVHTSSVVAADPITQVEIKKVPVPGDERVVIMRDWWNHRGVRASVGSSA